MKLDGSLAVVTGGVSGIGRAIAEMLLQHGVKVIMVDINEEKGNELEKELKKTHTSEGCITYMACDVSSSSQLEETFKNIKQVYGHWNILCNNAGIVDESNWKRTINTNLGAVVQGTLLGLEYMDGGGVIINTASTGGLHPVSFSPVYCAAKFGVVGFTRSIAPSAQRKKGIRVNCVCPGNTDTNFFTDLRNIDITEQQREIVESTPKQSPKAVAKCIMDLITDESDTGQVVKVTYEDGVEYVNYHDVVI